MKLKSKKTTKISSSKNDDKNKIIQQNEKTDFYYNYLRNNVNNNKLELKKSTLNQFNHRDNKFKQKSSNKSNQISKSINKDNQIKLSYPKKSLENHPEETIKNMRNLQITNSLKNITQATEEKSKSDIDKITPQENEIKKDIDPTDISNDKDFIEHPKPKRPKLKLELMNFSAKNVTRFLIPFFNKFNSFHSLGHDVFKYSNVEYEKAFNLSKTIISNQCSIEFKAKSNFISVYFDNSYDYDYRDVVYNFYERFKHYNFSKSILDNIKSAASCGMEFVPWLTIATSPMYNELGCAEVECQYGKMFVCSVKYAVGSWHATRRYNGGLFKDEWAFVLRDARQDHSLLMPKGAEFVDLLHDQAVPRGVLGCTQRINGLTPDSLNKRYNYYCEQKCVDFSD
eukprot:Mrub_04701.p1 GENE.Mrub_04701~~Mrub_04701.p1  ORF type:complete len:404 (+),score=101.76 Mrub_04701:24-1214(+)